jgi:DtxR family transcriptional regulator, Mn-dependent transcriptional regulator
MVDKIAETLSRSVQDYLKTIFVLTGSGKPIGTVELAEALDVSPASVSNMIQKLDAHEPPLVVYHKHRGVTLTVEGVHAALSVIRRHRLIEQFLSEILGYSWDRVHKDAEELEHVVSPYLEDRIADLLGEPQFDPHGEPIPNRLLEMTDDRNVIPLSELGEGHSGEVQQMDSRKVELLNFFMQIGLELGKSIRVLQSNPLDGTQMIALDDQDESYVIGPAIARAILVKPL